MEGLFVLGYLLLFSTVIIVAFLFWKSSKLLKELGKNGLVLVINRYMIMLLVLSFLDGIYIGFVFFYSQRASAIYTDMIFRLSMLVEQFLLVPLSIGATLYLIYGIVSSQEGVAND